LALGSLPDREHARGDEAKVRDYLLSLAHPDGRSKAQFFMRFGFRPSEPRALAAALLELGKSNDVVSVVRSAYGVRYTVDGALRAPDGRTPKVRTVWLQTAETKGPRLITAHPL
jgi:hypothetical protein